MAYQNSNNKDLKKTISGYLKYWYIFLASVALFVVLAYLFIRYETIPEYRVSTVILVQDKDKGSATSDLESFSDLGLIKSTRNVEDEIGILKSSSIMEKVLRNLSMGVTYYAQGSIDDVNLYSENIPISVEILDSTTIKNYYPVVITLKNDEEVGIKISESESDFSFYNFNDTINKPYGSFRIVKKVQKPTEFMEGDIVFQFTDVNLLASDLAEKLAVDPVNERGGLLELSLLDPIPQRGKAILNELISVYEQEGINYRNQLALKTISMIDERLQLITGELTDVEKNVEQFKQENDLTNVSSDAEMYIQQATEYNSQLADFETQIAVLNSIENYLRGSNAENTMVPSSLNIQDPTLVGLISRFNDLQLQKRRMLETTPAGNPLVVDIQRQLTTLRSNILENLSNIKQGLNITKDNLQSNSYRFQSRISKVPTVERGLTEINRQQSTKQGLYLFLLQKREEEALSIAAPVSNTRIVDEPKAGAFPVSPNKTSIYLGSVLLGLFLPFSFVYVKDLLDDKVQTTKDIEELTNTPILGQIALDETNENIVAKEKSSTPIAELFRLIRFNLKFITTGNENKVILVTSGDKGEGKTFFSTNLGVSLASSGSKVVVLSFDLRAPKLMSYIGMSDEFGITDYLVNDNIEVQDLFLSHADLENITFIGSGRIPPNAGEIMLHDKIGVMIRELRTLFDYVIIDTAPVGKVADIFALGPFADATLYIVRSNRSKKDSLKEIDQIYRGDKLKNPMIVLNGVNIKDSYGYYGERKRR
ncbi:GumC family protein [Autumnicola psychrophila]|uniref:non-specific protein-tyrosine kinase n=1 Tax=Autumnicola psychrophila TaxID=3075592 RepID=A0ABU3DQS7_9FLAO|nr:polysaccharide biosynthesis tyrosine autokinase [Zunongwangia sp. F225]MDT0686061.1 polysaccharide biosynthesis tyrosine autokinase [Zunongwangia sp. F225]